MAARRSGGRAPAASCAAERESCGSAERWPRRRGVEPPREAAGPPQPALPVRRVRLLPAQSRRPGHEAVAVEVAAGQADFAPKISRTRALPQQILAAVDDRQLLSTTRAGLVFSRGSTRSCCRRRKRRPCLDPIAQGCFCKKILHADGYLRPFVRALNPHEATSSSPTKIH
ncbi:unnamed protein product [Urochloa humidicola]